MPWTGIGPPTSSRKPKKNNFGSVVVGRRGLITFIDEYFVGRISDQVLKLADELAVWVI
jgi:hypothetical protein